MKKQLIVASALVSVAVVTVPTVFAYNYGAPASLTAANRLVSLASKSATLQPATVSALKTKADNYINERVDALNSLLARIQEDKKLTDNEKSTLSSQIQSAITGLQQLKVKIDADTTVADIRTDGKLIFTQFRVYEVLMPQIRTLIVIDELQQSTTTMQSLTSKLQTLIGSLQSQGKDVSKEQRLVNDMNTQLTTINTKLTTDKNTVMELTPTSTNPHQSIANVRKDLGTVRNDFAKIRSDIGQLRVDFQQEIKNTSPKPSAASSSAIQK